jgi:hypothetical protein
MTHTMIKDLYNFTHRGKIEAKNKGQIDMYFVDSKKKSKADMKEVEPSSSMAQG